MSDQDVGVTSRFDQVSRTAVGPSRPEERHRGRKRQRLNKSDKAIVVLLVVIAAAAAVAVSNAAPTTVAWIDALQRFVLAALVATAGLRSRRWALVVGSAIVTIFSPGVAMLVGFVALAVVVVLAVVDKRSRMVGCAVAGVVGVLSLSLRTPGPTGIDSLVALAAVFPILVSGYRIHVASGRGRRRRWRLIFAGIGVVVGLILVLTAVALATSWRQVQAGISSAQAGLATAAKGDTDRSAMQFASARDAFSKADSVLGSAWASSGLLLPVVGANLSAVQDSVRAGVQLSETAGSLTGQIDFDSVQLPGGGVDLAKVASLAEPLTEATDTLAAADDSLQNLTSPWLLDPLQDKLDVLGEKVTTTHHQGETALMAVQDAPVILGSEGVRRYLFLFGNPAEARDLGGHLGNWAEVVAANGHLELVKVGDPSDLSIPAAKAPKDLSERYPASLVEMDPVHFPHNWGATRDLPTIAKLASELYPLATGRDIDGVVYADVRSFAALLSLTGPMKVPELDPPFTLTKDNAVDFLTRGQFVRFESESVAGDALEQVIHSMFDKLTSSRLPGPERLSRVFAPLVADGEFRMASVHASDNELLNRLGLLGQIHVVAGQDLLAVINRNAGPSKIDSFLRRDVTVNVIWNPLSGGVESRVDVVLHNDASPEGLNRTIAGNDASVPMGTNVTDLSVLTPFELRSVVVDSVPHVSQPQRENGYWRYTVRLAIPPKGTRSISFDLQGRVDPGAHYVLSFNGQSLLNPGKAKIVVQSMSGQAVLAGEPGIADRQGGAEIPQSRDEILIWRSEGQ